MEEAENNENANNDSSSEDELFPIKEAAVVHNVFEYLDATLYSGIIKAVMLDDLTAIKDLVAKGRSVNINENNGNTPLHIAVIMERLEIVNYLVGVDEINLNARNHMEETPLYLSASTKRIDIALKLISSGADVNICNHEDQSPLHNTIEYSTKVSLALIEAGADLNCQDYVGYTPLHKAVMADLPEHVAMLLYYQADANICSHIGNTPFMHSIFLNLTDIQDLLFDYVVDVNETNVDGKSILFLAIEMDSPLIPELMRRKADVNFVKHPIRGSNALTVNPILSLKYLAAIWKKFNYKRSWLKERNILFYLLHTDGPSNEYIVESMRVILEKSSVRKIKQIIFKAQRYCKFIIALIVDRFFVLGLPESELFKFVCILLSSGLDVHSVDLDVVFDRYGYCELFKLLLHMDITIEMFCMITPRTMYRIPNGTCRGVMTETCSYVFDADNFLDYFVSPKYVRALLEQLLLANEALKEDQLRHINGFMRKVVMVPSLLELARNKCRTTIWKEFNVINSRKFYTVLNHMDIPITAKKIISMETPLYKRRLNSNDALFRTCMMEMRSTYLTTMLNKHLC